MAEFYHNSVTDKSFQFLAELNKNYKFVLIGGWAVFLYAQALKSKDIDIILDYDELGKLRKNFAVNKNERLKKYEIETGEFDIDIYVPHYSDLGLPAEEIMKSAKTRNGFFVPSLEMLLLLKLYAWQERRGSIKGRKDELDILTLISSEEFVWPDYLRLVNKFNLGLEHKSFVYFLEKVKRVPELKLNEQQASRLKRKIMQEIKNFKDKK